jgi:YD repeat-containing protein
MDSDGTNGGEGMNDTGSILSCSVVNNVWGSGDGTGAYEAVLTNPGDISVSGPDGTVYSFAFSPNGPDINTAGGFIWAGLVSVEDRNGNVFSNDTDTLGRGPTQYWADGVYASSPPANWPWSNGFYASGQPAPWNPMLPTTLAGENPGTGPATLPPSTKLSWSQCGTVGSGWGTQPQTGTGYTGITSFPLPDGNQYQFDYWTNADGTANPYGLLDKITYPNGGYVAYTWGLPPGWSDGAYYTWQVTPANTNDGTEEQQLANVVTNECAVEYSMPVITHLAVSYDGVHIARTQDFTYNTVMPSEGTNQGTPPQWVSKTTTVVTHDLVQNTYSATVYNYLPNNVSLGPSWLSGDVANEQTVKYYAGNNASGTPLRTVNKLWDNYGHLLSENTVLENGLTGSLVEHCYSYPAYTLTGTYLFGFILPTGTSEYDYGTGTSTGGPCTAIPGSGPHGNLLRTTSIQYASLGSSPTFPSVTYNNSGNCAPSFCTGQQAISVLASFPQSVVVTNGQGNEVTETDYAYTNTVTPTSGVVQHDSQYAGSGAGANVPRGNVASITKTCNGSACSNTATSVTTFTYDDTGQALSETDPCGNATCSDMSSGSHTTTFSYVDNFTSDNGQPTGHTNAYVTKITDTLGQTKKFSYGFNDGKIRSITDENNQTTTYCYHSGNCSGGALDPWLRLTQILSPDGGNTTASYNDAGSNPSTTVTKLINGDTAETSTMTFDGMGHAIQTQLSSDLDGTDYVDTTYDGGGHVFAVSNPHRSAPAATDGTITFNYDAMGRKTKQTQTDGSNLWWCYDSVQDASHPQPNCHGNLSGLGDVTWMDQADEVGNDQQDGSDALGHLLAVFEPNPISSGSFMKTLYTYNTLDDLTNVTQYGVTGTDTPRTRTFAYDALSRLLTSTNPETGAINYVYDANGNLSVKTDARNVTSSYTYNTINQLLSKTYTGAPAGSLSSCYQYGTGATTIERLVAEWTQAGTCPNAAPGSGYYTLRTISGYDAMGRIASEQQCVSVPGAVNSCTPSGTNPGALNYTYDVAGNLTNYSNGVNNVPTVGAINFTNIFDGAGRLSTLTSSWNDTLHPPALFTADPTTGYTPAAAIQSMVQGNYIAVTKTYDKRLRTTGETVTHP